jgi:general secretion pathway protein I
MKKKADNEKGFTLLEAMIALMIVAIALPALVTLVMTQLDGAAAIRDKTYAYWVAQNQLERIRLLQQQKMAKRITNYNLPDKDSGIENMNGLSWQWQMKTVAIESLPVPGFKRIEIAVRLLGAAQSLNLGVNTVDEDQPALAQLTGYISDPEQ